MIRGQVAQVLVQVNSGCFQGGLFLAFRWILSQHLIILMSRNAGTFFLIPFRICDFILSLDASKRLDPVR